MTVLESSLDTGICPETGASEDAPLIRGARAGDTRAFEALYRRHVGRIYGLCLRLTATPELAEELTQETFIKAWQNLAGFRGDSAFSTWLFRLAANLVIDHQRKQRSWFSRFSSTDDEGFIEPWHEPVDGVRRDLEAAIAKLPSGARTVFVLHDVEGWQHDEIANHTGTAVGTCKAQLHRARKLLKEWLSL